MEASYSTNEVFIGDVKEANNMEHASAPCPPTNFAIMTNNSTSTDLLLAGKKWNQFQSQNITQNTNKMNKVINMAIVLDKNT